MKKEVTKPKVKATTKPKAKTQSEKKKVVRAVKYEPDAFIDEICSRLAEGEPLRSICRSEGMPSWQIIYGWMDDIPELADRIARAREVGCDAIACEALKIADTPIIGESLTVDDKGQKVVREDMLGHRKLQVDTRLKLLAKWSPQKYGDKQAVELTGANGGPVEVSDADKAARLAGILALAQARKAKEGPADAGE